MNEPKRVEDLKLGDMSSPRYRRAINFTHRLMAMMRDFLPTDQDCWRRIEDYIFEIGYSGNVELINVPPELDALDKLKLERAMLEFRMKPRIELTGPCPKCGQAADSLVLNLCEEKECPVSFI